jgi:hypothetical protein
MIDTFGTALAVPVAFLLMLLAPVVIEAQNRLIKTPKRSPTIC